MSLGILWMFIVLVSMWGCLFKIGEVPGEVPSPMTPSNRTRKLPVYLKKKLGAAYKNLAQGVKGDSMSPARG